MGTGSLYWGLGHKKKKALLNNTKEGKEDVQEKRG
jgi:hypothetical protein